MPYVKRNQSGAIIAVSLESLPGYEEVSTEDNEVQQFYAQLHASQTQLQQSDFDVVRVLEDLVHLLTDNNLIRFTDLPEAAQHKLSRRRHLRESTQILNVLDDDTSLL